MTWLDKLFKKKEIPEMDSLVNQIIYENIVPSYNNGIIKGDYYILYKFKKLKSGRISLYELRFQNNLELGEFAINESKRKVKELEKVKPVLKKQNRRRKKSSS